MFNNEEKTKSSSKNLNNVFDMLQRKIISEEIKNPMKSHIISSVKLKNFGTVSFNSKKLSSIKSYSKEEKYTKSSLNPKNFGSISFNSKKVSSISSCSKDENYTKSSLSLKNLTTTFQPKNENEQKLSCRSQDSKKGELFNINEDKNEYSKKYDKIFQSCSSKSQRCIDINCNDITVEKQSLKYTSKQTENKYKESNEQHESSRICTTSKQTENKFKESDESHESSKISTPTSKLIKKNIESNKTSSKFEEFNSDFLNDSKPIPMKISNTQSQQNSDFQYRKTAQDSILLTESNIYNFNQNNI